MSPYTPAAPIREHLDHLQRLGVGLRTVAQITGVARSLLQRIRRGKVRRLRHETARAILGVSGFDRAGGSLVDGARTWDMIAELQAVGVRFREIATACAGREVRKLQLARAQVTRRRAEAVEQIHWRVWRDLPELRALCQHEVPVASVAELVSV